MFNKCKSEESLQGDASFVARRQEVISDLTAAGMSKELAEVLADMTINIFAHGPFQWKQKLVAAGMNDTQAEAVITTLIKYAAGR